jgi:LuxR family maltose regulon positive regulatory protein
VSTIEAPSEGDPPLVRAAALDVDRTKLRPPRSSHAAAGHQRLLELRPDRAVSPVVAVVAPAGYGKSTLLAEWVAQEPDRALWVSLDTHDDDPLRLVNHIAAALLASGLDAPDLEDGLRSPAASVWSMLMPRLSAALQDAVPVTLVLDDAHAVTSSESWDVIDWLVLHAPARSQLAIAGRNLGGSVMPRLQVAGKLSTVGADELALRDDEAQQLLQATGADRSGAAAARLNQACGGWAAGLLLSKSAVASEVPTALGSDAQTDVLARYIEAEVLGSLSPADRSFVLRASILRTASGPLCDAVLERTDSGAVLDRLCTTNTFTSRVGHGWCRTHELVRTALLRVLEDEDPAQVATLRERAATWHAEHGSPAEAVRYAMESGRAERTAQLIGRFANRLFSSGQWAMVSQWLDWAEAQGLSLSNQSVLTAAVTGSALTGKPERSVRWAAASERARTGQATVDEGLRALVAAWQCQRGAETMLADAQCAEGLIPDDSPWRKSVLAALGLAQLMQGLEQESRSAFRRVVDEPGPAWLDVAARSGCLAFLAIGALDRRQLDDAAVLIEEATRIRDESGITEQGLQSLVDGVRARVVLARSGDVEAARRLLTHAQHLRPLLSWAMPSVALIARIELVKASLGLGDVGGARAVTRELADILRRRPGLGRLEAEAGELARRVAEQAGALQGPSSLTAAELRLMPWLATHLSFREIGERLFLSTNTVKTEALSIYRKLGASSRSEAVEAAVHVGVLDPASLPGILGAHDWTAGEEG